MATPSAANGDDFLPVGDDAPAAEPAEQPRPLKLRGTAHGIRKPRPTEQGLQLKPAKQLIIPVARGVAPPPGYEPPDPAEPLPEPPVADAEERPSRRRWLLLAGAIGGVCCLLFLVVLVGMFASTGLSAKETQEALAGLKAAQRDWWDNEGLATQGCKDPEAALEHLRRKQRNWWEMHALAAPGDTDGVAPLGRLEAMQQAWWEEERLANGQPCADPQGALARLEALNRPWWNGQALARAKPDAERSDEETASEAELASLKLKLAEKAGTKRFLDSGGTVESEEAVQLGLQWLASQQNADGSWAPNGGGRARASGVTTTALAVLPFLARGETHKGSQDINTYTKQVEHALLYLIAQQRPDGDLRGGSNMYTHALATMALCEALGLTNDPLLKAPCQRALDFLIRAQARDRGWRYTPAPPNSDLSVTSWCLMALKSGQMAGLQVPRETLEGAADFLRTCERPDGGYGYTRGSPGHSPPTPAVMTAAGLVCRNYLASSSGHTDNDRTSDRQRAVVVILKNPPRSNIKNYYYWYYSMYALQPVGGDAWKQWNPQVRDLLVSLQEKDNASLKGSWDPQGSYQLQAAGRVGVTALALLTLEVYYRHLPLNRPELGEMHKDLSKATR
ncbi:MAG: terpene cyclase/mutase family protein [Planctomycetia bacterium]|nr:terpene cyclase/mutase family protein [Planctomycetia bacterium]